MMGLFPLGMGCKTHSLWDDGPTVSRKVRLTWLAGRKTGFKEIGMIINKNGVIVHRQVKLLEGNQIEYRHMKIIIWFLTIFWVARRLCKIYENITSSQYVAI